MTRKCKFCKAVELKPAAQCENIVEKKGYCSITCLADHQAEKRIAATEKKKRKEHREAKAELKTRQEWIRDAQRWFNKWVRLRDAKESCISCDASPNDNNLLTGSRWDAGHYRSVGANPELRFEPDNCFKQCVKCNRDLSGNVVNMRIGVEKRIGAERLSWLEGKHKPQKWTISDLKAIKAKYKTLCQELKKELQNTT